MADKKVGKKSSKKVSKKSAGKKTGARRKKVSATKSRQPRAQTAPRQPAETQRVISDDERLDEFRKSFFQSVLPDLPPIEGYHVCWLTTTNPRDSIPMRVRLGYEPVKAEDIPGWEHATLKTGDYAGCIGVNEMIAFKLPMSLYERYMYEAHHVQPLAEEEKLASVMDVIQEQAAAAAKSGSRGIKMEFEEGMAELGQDLDPGSFAENLGEVAPGEGY
jgi:hypothetical protein